MVHIASEKHSELFCVFRTVTFVYYVVSLGGRMVSTVDYPPPSSFGTLNVSSVSPSRAAQVQSIQVSGQLLSADYFNIIQTALAQAWKATNTGK